MKEGGGRGLYLHAGRLGLVHDEAGNDVELQITGEVLSETSHNGYRRCLEIDSSLRMESILCKMHFCHMVRCFESCLYKVFKSEHLN